MKSYLLTEDEVCKSEQTSVVHRPARCIASDRVRARNLSTGHRGLFGRSDRARSIVAENFRAWAELQCGAPVKIYSVYFKQARDTLSRLPPWARRYRTSSPPTITSHSIYIERRHRALSAHLNIRKTRKKSSARTATEWKSVLPFLSFSRSRVDGF
jgi:hypothetical protein